MLFSYLEILLLLNDPAKVAQEKSRMEQLHQEICSTRSEGAVDEFFEDGILAVLDQMATWLSEVHTSASQDKLVEYFNDFGAAYSLFALRVGLLAILHSSLAHPCRSSRRITCNHTRKSFKTI